MRKALTYAVILVLCGAGYYLGTKMRNIPNAETIATIAVGMVLAGVIALEVWIWKTRDQR